MKSLRGKDVEKPAAILTIPIHPDLKELVGREADKAGVPMNELVAQILAKHFDRDDLADVPRKPLGRPRKALAS